MDDRIRKASAAFGRLQELQAKLEEANLGHLELASAGTLVTIAGVVASADERDRALAIAKAAGFRPHDALTIDDPRNTDELTLLVREARASRDPVPMLEKAIALADERNVKDWRIRLRLELDAALRGPMRYAEAEAACREAVAIEANAETLYALAWCLHEAAAIGKYPDLDEIERHYVRAIELAEPGSSTQESARRMLDGLRRLKERAARTS